MAQLPQDETAAKMLKCIGHQERESILEVGAGPGALGQHFKGMKYLGVEKSKSLVKKHNEISKCPGRCVHGEANALPVADGSWDHVIVNSVMQYCESMNYADEAIKEMERAARKTVLISDIRRKGRQAKKKTGFELVDDEKDQLTHLTFTTDHFKRRGYKIIEKFYDVGYDDPFCAFKKIEKRD